ncbi:MAG TPA: tetratricopeptide repeat protein [Anaerolineales bacterium]|nr:tetratricopeptide repeat protein [Anaerolineales bacterium]
MENTAIELSEKGKKAFENGDFEGAVQIFTECAELYLKEENFLDAAEAKNNLSVTLLKAGKAEEALKAAKETDLVFEEAGDKLRQATALGNQASALDEMGELDEALQLYQKSAQLFGEVDKNDYQEMVLKSIAGIELRRGKLEDTAFTMLQSLGAVKKPNIFQRILKFFLRFFG